MPLPCRRTRAAAPPPGGSLSPILKTLRRLLISPNKRRVIQEQLTRGATASLMAASANVSRTVDRHYIETGGKSSKQGRPPVSHPDEEEPLMQCIWTRALIGRGLTRDACLAAWEKYILVLSPTRQDQTRAFCLVEQSRGKKKREFFIYFRVAGRA